MTNASPSWWTDERIAALKAQFERGTPYSEIAVAIGAASRNAVIGKAHRLHLFRTAHAAMARRAPRTRRTRATTTHANGHCHQMSDEKSAPIAAPVGFANPVTLIALTGNHCRWPGPGPTLGPMTLYCGNPIAPGQPYCPTHARIAYAKPQRAPR